MANTTPFTTRDGEHYLSLLHRIRKTVIDLIAENAQRVVDLSTLHDSVERGMNDLILSWNTAYAALASETRETMTELGMDRSGVFDPTTGERPKSWSLALSNVYDNLRFYSLFAREYDALGLTAKEYDDMEMTARHFDLYYTYPDFHAEMKDN